MVTPDVLAFQQPTASLVGESLLYEMRDSENLGVSHLLSGTLEGPPQHRPCEEMQA